TMGSSKWAAVQASSGLLASTRRSAIVPRACSRGIGAGGLSSAGKSSNKKYSAYNRLVAKTLVRGLLAQRLPRFLGSIMLQFRYAESRNQASFRLFQMLGPTRPGGIF